MLTRELNCELPGCEWFQWLRTGLSVNDGRHLIVRLRNVTSEKKREAATLASVAALQRTPRVMTDLLEDANMSNEVARIIEPLVQKKYGDKIAAAEEKADQAIRARDQAIRARDQAIRARDQAVEARNQAVEKKEAAIKKLVEMAQLYSSMLESLDGNIDSSARAKMLEFKEILAGKRPDSLGAAEK